MALVWMKIQPYPSRLTVPSVGSLASLTIVVAGLGLVSPLPKNFDAGRQLSNEGPTPALVTAIKSEVPHRPLCLAQAPASADSVVERG